MEPFVHVYERNIVITTVKYRSCTFNNVKKSDGILCIVYYFDKALFVTTNEQIISFMSVDSMSNVHVQANYRSMKLNDAACAQHRQPSLNRY